MADRNPWTRSRRLVSDPGPAADTYEAIERRVWWGALAGFGTLLATLRSLRPWSVALASFVFWIVAGLLAARSIGLVLDGTDSPKQWMWTVVELAICVVASLYLRRRRTTCPQVELSDASAARVRMGRS